MRVYKNENYGSKEELSRSPSNFHKITVEEELKKRRATSSGKKSALSESDLKNSDDKNLNTNENFEDTEQTQPNFQFPGFDGDFNLGELKRFESGVLQEGTVCPPGYCGSCKITYPQSAVGNKKVFKQFTSQSQAPAQAPILKQTAYGNFAHFDTEGVFEGGNIPFNSTFSENLNVSVNPADCEMITVKKTGVYQIAYSLRTKEAPEEQTSLAVAVNGAKVDSTSVIVSSGEISNNIFIKLFKENTVSLSLDGPVTLVGGNSASISFLLV